MYFPKHGDLHEFYDPSDRRMHLLELPELRGSRILYAKGSWLLLVRLKNFVIFFFCPYTREMFTLTRLRPGHHVVAFSAPPTSPDCIVFAIYHLLASSIIVGTCRPGATKWDAFIYDNDQQYMSRTWNQVIFSNARFYCMNVSGQVGVFNPESNTWGLYYTPAPKYMLNLSFHYRWSAKFMAEHDGEIYVVCCSAAANPVIYRLDRVNKTWTEMMSLGRMAIFANARSSLSGTDLVGRMAGKMAGCVVFSKVLLHGRQCVMYSPRRGRYYPANRFHNWNEEEPFDSVWIDAPDDASIFL
ncbi:F-box/kelch-repeat protein at1g57790 [Phtheirospermum japonicum]|uniref:F-box/kelch-repeat protein at1g57790 n=1 Tax=Phtheirospermum japonicum TaxID=374723 RepID=A0A830CT43_9LAMI|nr:F-box/kelch-repeat protein at1g57790 [Phtheirospermum japonicum]